MATKDEPLPATMLSPETGETLTRAARPFTVAYKGESVAYICRIITPQM
jgi:HTH-type transcriptional regulator / antitoxin MqsA